MDGRVSIRMHRINHDCHHVYLQIEYCAVESETNGLLEDAVLLYDLANKPEQALKVLIRLVALVRELVFQQLFFPYKSFQLPMKLELSTGLTGVNWIL